MLPHIHLKIPLSSWKMLVQRCFLQSCFIEVSIWHFPYDANTTPRQHIWWSSLGSLKQLQSDNSLAESWHFSDALIYRSGGQFGLCTLIFLHIIPLAGQHRLVSFATGLQDSKYQCKSAYQPSACFRLAYVPLVKISPMSKSRAHVEEDTWVNPESHDLVWGGGQNYNILP